jgi:hypothetical protein
MRTKLSRKTFSEAKQDIRNQFEKDRQSIKNDPDNAGYHRAHMAALLWVMQLLDRTEKDVIVFRDGEQ